MRHEVDGLKIYARPESVAWGLGTLFADWSAARKMGEEGRKSVAASFTWEVIADRTLDVYYGLPGMVRPTEAAIELPEPPRPEALQVAEEVKRIPRPRRRKPQKEKKPKAQVKPRETAPSPL